MRKVATLAAALLIGGGMAVLGGATAAQAAPITHRTTCYTTMPVVPRFAPQPATPKHCGKNTKPQYRWLTAWI